MFFPFTAPKGLALALSLAVPAFASAQQPHAGHGAAAAQAPAASAAAAAKPSTAPARGGAYRSPFDGYRGFGDAESVPWREANDNVGRIGGWRAYAREAAAGSPQGADNTKADTAGATNGGQGAHRRP